MKKLILIILSAVFLIVMTGCEGWFNKIPKDTVMVKKITHENKGNEVEYEGVLSQDAVKTLSLNAVNKYYDESLSMDKLQFQLMTVDQKKINDLMNEVEPRASLQQTKEPQKIEFNNKTELDHISGGLYYVTWTRSDNKYNIYDVVLNARDGDVMRISRLVDTSKPTSSDSNERAKIFDIVDRFVKNKGSYPSTELSQRQDMIRWGNSAVEFYYTSKDSDTIKYCVTINVRTGEISGFSKDVMALLSYYSKF